MKIFKTMSIGIALISLLSANAYAGDGDTHSGRAITHSGKASVHSAGAAAHGSVGAVKLTSGSVAVPLYVIGSAGTVSTHVADAFMEIATTPAGEPLKITDETVTAGPPPDKVLANQNKFDHPNRSDALHKTFTIDHRKDLYWYGEYKYTVDRGDQLTIVKTKPCRSDRTLECWIVEHEKLGKGVMRANFDLLN